MNVYILISHKCCFGLITSVSTGENAFTNLLSSFTVRGFLRGKLKLQIAVLKTDVSGCQILLLSVFGCLKPLQIKSSFKTWHGNRKTEK